MLFTNNVNVAPPPYCSGIRPAPGLLTAKIHQDFDTLLSPMFQTTSLDLSSSLGHARVMPVCTRAKHPGLNSGDDKNKAVNELTRGSLGLVSHGSESDMIFFPRL